MGFGKSARSKKEKAPKLVGGAPKGEGSTPAPLMLHHGNAVLSDDIPRTTRGKQLLDLHKEKKKLSLDWHVLGAVPSIADWEEGIQWQRMVDITNLTTLIYTVETGFHGKMINQFMKDRLEDQLEEEEMQGKTEQEIADLRKSRVAARKKESATEETEEWIPTEEESTIMNQLVAQFPRGKVVKFLRNKADCELCVAKSADQQRYSIVFRGSETMTDFMYDAMIYQINAGTSTKRVADFPADVMVHQGFHAQLFYEDLYGQLKKLIAEQIAENPTWGWTLCGHSLGAALTTLCGYYLAREPEFKQIDFYAVSIASPRVGNRAFKQSFEEGTPNLACMRIGNNRDIVTAFPNWGYYHVGTSLHYKSGPHQWRLNADTADPLRNPISETKGKYWSFHPIWDGCVSAGDHSLTKYLEALEEMVLKKQKASQEKALQEESRLQV